MPATKILKNDSKGLLFIIFERMLEEKAWALNSQCLPLAFCEQHASSEWRGWLNEVVFWQNSVFDMCSTKWPNKPLKGTIIPVVVHIVERLYRIYITARYLTGFIFQAVAKLAQSTQVFTLRLLQHRLMRQLQRRKLFNRIWIM